MGQHNIPSIDRFNGVLAYGAKADGVQDDYGFLNTAFALENDIHYTHGVTGVYRIATSGTIGGNNPATHRFVRGARLRIENGVTLNFLGWIDAPEDQQIFELVGTGKVVLNLKKIYPGWWGAVGDGITDDINAFNAAYAALPHGGTIQLMGKTYGLGGLLVVQPQIELTGLGQSYVQGIQVASPTGAHFATKLLDLRINPASLLIDIPLIGDPIGRGNSIKNLVIDSPSTNKTAFVMRIASTGFVLENVYVKGAIIDASQIPNPGANDPGLIQIDQCEQVQIKNCVMHGGPTNAAPGKGQIWLSGVVPEACSQLHIDKTVFYDCLGPNLAGTGLTVIRVTGCMFDPLYRTPGSGLPSIAIDLHCNDGVFESNTMFAGTSGLAAPTGSQVALTGGWKIAYNTISTPSTGITLASGGSYEVTGNVITAFCPISFNAGEISGGPNTCTPWRSPGFVGGIAPFDVQRAIVIGNGTYAGAVNIKDFDLGTVNSDTSSTPVTLTNATNTTPIVCTAATLFPGGAGNMVNGDLVNIIGVTGNTNANGIYRVKNVNAGAGTFELIDKVTSVNIAGNGVFGGSPTVQRVWYFMNSIYGVTTAAVVNAVAGRVRYNSLYDTSFLGPTVGGLVKLDKVDARVRHVGSATVLTQADSCDTFTNELFATDPWSITLPAIVPGLRFRFLRRPLVRAVTIGNVTPISVDYGAAHNFSTGDTTEITTAIVAANGKFIVTVTGANTLTLNGTTAGGAGSGVGTTRTLPVMQINAAGSDQIFFPAERDGVSSISSIDTGAFNAEVEIEASFWIDTTGPFDIPRWRAKPVDHSWIPTTPTKPTRGILWTGGPAILSGTADPPTTTDAVDGTLFLRTDTAKTYMRRGSTWQRLSASWDPRYLLKLITWLDSEAGITQASGAVSSWADQSGHGHDYLQSTTANKPAYVSAQYNEQPAIRGNADRARYLSLTAYTFSAGEGTIFFVFTHSTNVSTYHWADNLSHGLIETFSANLLEWFNGGDRYTIATTLVGSATPHIVTVSQKDGVILDLYFDGVFVSTHVPAVTIRPPNQIIASSGANGGSGDYLEMLVVDRQMVAADMLQIHRYLGFKYGIAVP